ncbi:MAG: Laminin sub domain 2, partial [Ilumatobacteraceae bacterium]|nr:Laminin sub domain 2 [Ilumatobacteraceae bacterium]
AVFTNVAITTPPTANPDSYSVNEDTTLTVAASGVLANDTDPENDALTAVLVSGATGLTLNANGSFTYLPPASFAGTASFTYKANDGAFDSGPITVTLVVNPANERPSFIKGANQSIVQAPAAQAVPGWATAINPGAGESAQLINFIVTNTSNATFSVQPAVDSTGALTYTPAAGATGVVTVSVSIHDNGGTANGGFDTSAVQTFTITLAADTTGPTGGSVDAAGLVGTGARYAPSLTLSLNLVKGTDPNGLATTGAQLKRATAALTWTGGADGACDTFGAYTLVTGGTDPATPTTDTVADQACYSYQYVVADTIGNSSTWTSPVIKVDTVAPGAPALVFSAFTNTAWSGSGGTVYYRSAATSGSFTTTATVVDPVAGIAAYGFPALGTTWTSTPGATGVNTYAWTGGPAAPGTAAVTATNNAGRTSTGTSFTVTADGTAPNVGTITYLDGSQSETSVSVSFTTGTDSASGVGTRLLQRQSAILTGVTCGTFGALATLANGTNPTSPFVDTVATGRCYRYGYVTSDNVGNVGAAATSANVVKVSSYTAAVSGTAGLLSFWRLGESTVSTDTFTGTAGVTLQARSGEIGATWTKQLPLSTADALITSAGRIRKNGSSAFAVYSASGVPTGADYAIEADVFVASSVVNDRIGILGRVDPAIANGTFYAASYSRASQTWVLAKVVNGVQTMLAQTAAQALAVGTTYRLTLDMNGTTIRLLVNGAQQLSSIDAAITTAGRGGVVMGDGVNATALSDTTGMHLDNFSITPPLADSAGTNVGDYRNGPTLGTPGAIVGDASTAVQFSGVSDYATVARQISADFSIELWFKSTTGGIGTGAQWWQGAGLVDAQVSGPPLRGFGVSLRADGKVVAGVGKTDVSIISGSGYNDGGWHHVVFTREMASGALVLYVDGVAVGAATGSTAALTDPPAINFGRLQIGTNSFTGSLDDVAVYTTVLTPATVIAHHDLG